MNATNGPVLVIGATGQQGRATTRHLLEDGCKVNAFVRNPESPAALALRAAGADLVVGDLDDPASVRSAMDGAYGVFLMLTMMSGANITTDGIAAEIRRGTTAVETANEAGIEHLVYSSVKGADENSGVRYYRAKEHIEARVAELDLPATILRPTFFMDNFATYNRPVRTDAGELLVNLAVQPSVPVSLISIDDIGAFASLSFQHAADFRGRTLTLAGDRLTPPAIAAVFSAIAGIPARHNQVPLDQLRAFDEYLAEMYDYFNSHPDESVDIPALRSYHPTLASLESWLATTSWRP